MRMGMFGTAFSFSALVVALPAQVLDLRGRVVHRDGSPVPDAAVELKALGTATRTAADGTFALDGNTAARPGPARAPVYRLAGGFVVVDARHPLDVRMEIADGAGRRHGSIARRLGTGRHPIALSEAMPAARPDAGLYFLRLEIGAGSFSHPFILAGRDLRGAVFGPADGQADGSESGPELRPGYRRRAAAKPAAAADSLRIRKAGYRDLVLAVAGYAAGNLGDLVLSAEQDGGGICARQRIERTGDGHEVVHCEALFDQPPRVRLPAAPAARAYAGRTREAFITPDGVAYPHASPGTADPEILRHASAIYDISLQGGKVAGYRPAVVFAESLFMAPLLGKAFEGIISGRTSASRYDLAPSLPIRVQFPAGTHLGEPRPPSTFAVGAAIVNLDAPVAAADGTCLPALASHGSRAPFPAGADIRFLVGRHPSMHAFGDDELVFELIIGGRSAGSLMSTAWFFTPLDLVKNTLAPTGTYSGVGHGTPGSIPLLELRAVSGGGGACLPR